MAAEPRNHSRTLALDAPGAGENTWQDSGEAQLVESLAADREGRLSLSEKELLQEVIRALRSIRFGSVVLTVHDRRLVEIHKTERIRRGFPTQATEKAL